MNETMESIATCGGGRFMALTLGSNMGENLKWEK